MFLLPAVYLTVPFFAGIVGNVFGHFGKGIFCICNDRNIYLDISGNRGRVNVNMDNLGVRGKFMKLSCDSVVKTCSNGKKYVTIAYSHVGCICTVHAKVSNKKRMVGRNCTSSHNSSYNRNTGFFHYFLEYLIGMGNIDSAACKEKWLLCLGKCFDRTFQLSDVDTGVWLVAADIYALWIFCTAQFSHYILGQVNENRSRASGTCNIEGFLNDTSKIFTVAYGDSILGNTAGNSYNINFLECIVSNQMTCYLTCEAHKRNAVIIGCSKACNKIGSTRTACYKTYSNFSSSTCVSIGCVNQCLFVTWKDYGDIILFV